VTGYTLSADADFDLDEIWEYIAADNLDAADRWIDAADHFFAGALELLEEKVKAAAGRVS
jgi:plasmid stabilization system protein ParE